MKYLTIRANLIGAHFLMIMLFKRNSFLFVVILTSFQVTGQKIDSLKALLEVSTDIVKIDLLRAIGQEYSDHDHKLALQYGLASFREAKLLNDSIRIIKAGRSLSRSLRQLDKIDSSNVINSEILLIAEKLNNTYHVINILNSFAISYTYSAEYDKALMYYMRSLDLSEQSKDTLLAVMILQNTGFVYYKLKDYNKGLDYFLRSMTIKKKINDDSDLDLLLINISSAYAYKQMFDEAQDYIDKVFVLCKNNCSDLINTQANFTQGVILFGLNKISDAEIHFKKSYSLSKKLDYVRFQFDNIDYLAQISIKKKEFDQAIDYLKEAEKLIQAGSPYNLEVIKIYAQLLKVYSLTKDYKQAAYYQQKYIQLKDSIYSEDLTTNLMKVEVEYQERENKAKIASQNDLLILKEQVIANQNLLNIAVFSMVIVLVVLAVILFRSNRQRKAINQLLELKVKERTKTLELDQAELMKACQERDLLLKKTVEHVRTSIGSIKGICLNGLTNPGDLKAQRYFQEVEDTSNSLSNALHSLQSRGNKFTAST